MDATIQQTSSSVSTLLGSSTEQTQVLRVDGSQIIEPGIRETTDDLANNQAGHSVFSTTFGANFDKHLVQEEMLIKQNILNAEDPYSHADSVLI